MTRYSITHTPTGRPNNEDEVTIWSTDTLKNRERVSNMKGAIDMFEVLAISWALIKNAMK